MIRKAVYILIGIVVLFTAVYVWGYREAQKPPANNPQAFLREKRSPDKQVLVCIGDSITHGRVSVNYVDIISERLRSRNILVINAGINSELAYNVVQRLDEIIACNPDFITILIGSNDAYGAVSDRIARQEIKEMKLPQRPTRPWFRENYLQICSTLQSRTHAKIALLSLPPIGEVLDQHAFKQSEIYSRTVKEVAEMQKLTYLPLHERMVDFLRNHPHIPKYPYRDDEQLMYIAIAKHLLLGRSFDEISQANGFLLLTDHLHLNSRGARMVADLIEGFVLGQPPG